MPASYANFQGEIDPLPYDVIVVDMEKGEKVTKSGILLGDDNGQARGIRPRWAKVYKIGEAAKKVVDYKEGEWILVEHGRWTFGFDIELTDGTSIYAQKIDTKCVMLASTEKPETI